MDDEQKKNFMEVFGPRLGRWSVECKSDPRWNNSGEAKGLVTMGGPQEMKFWIQYCTEEYGTPPADCTSSFMKH